MNRRERLSFVVSLATVGVLLLTGCAAREAVHPLSSYVVPDYGQKGVETIGLMPIGDQTHSDVAPSVVLSLLEACADEKTAYMFLSKEEVLGRAQKEGLRDQYSALLSGWKTKGEIDREKVASVGKGIGADALLFAEIFLWNKEWVSANTEGTSQSQVGVRLVLVSTHTGETLWEASDEQVMDSAYYSPDSGIGTHIDEGGMVRSSPLGGVPDPPPIEEVAGRVLDAIFKTFP